LQKNNIKTAGGKETLLYCYPRDSFVDSTVTGRLQRRHSSDTEFPAS